MKDRRRRRRGGEERRRKSSNRYIAHLPANQHSERGHKEWEVRLGHTRQSQNKIRIKGKIKTKSRMNLCASLVSFLSVFPPPCGPIHTGLCSGLKNCFASFWTVLSLGGCDLLLSSVPFGLYSKSDVSWPSRNEKQPSNPRGLWGFPIFFHMQAPGLQTSYKGKTGDRLALWATLFWTAARLCRSLQSCHRRWSPGRPGWAFMRWYLNTEIWINVILICCECYSPFGLFQSFKHVKTVTSSRFL